MTHKLSNSAMAFVALALAATTTVVALSRRSTP